MSKERARVLHERAVKAVHLHGWSEKELVVVFHELDTFGGYRYYGAKSLYDYAMKIHKLSEPVALNIINVARKSKEVPEIREAIVSGELSISKARKIVPVLTKENKDAWLELAKTSTSREIEKAVAIEKPKLAVQEAARFVARDTLQVTLALSEEEFQLLKRVMDLEAQRMREAVTQGNAVVASLKAYLEKRDPLKKAERAEARAQKSNENSEKKVDATAESNIRKCGTAGSVPFKQNDAAAPVSRHVKRNAIHSALRHALDMRDQRQCTQLDSNGQRCEEKRWLEYHHIIEVSKGGKDTLENMTTLCSGHDRMIHR